MYKVLVCNIILIHHSTRVPGTTCKCLKHLAFRHVHHQPGAIKQNKKFLPNQTERVVTFDKHAPGTGCEEMQNAKHGHNQSSMVILYLCFVSLSSGFHLPKCRNVPSHSRCHTFRIFSSKMQDGEQKKNSPEETFQQKIKERSPRFVDFPSFAYRDQTGYTGNDSFVSTKYKTQQGMDPDLLPQKAFEPRKILAAFLSSLTSQDWSMFQVSTSQKRTRLLNDRAYAKPEAFNPENLAKPPTLEDLSPPRSSTVDTFWIGTPARIISLVVPYYSFPFIVRFLDTFVTMPPAQLEEIVGKFGPGISILYGTFVSLTLSILYNRLQSIQEDVSKESAMVTLIVRDLLCLFRRDQDLAIEAAQCAAIHIRTLVRGSRGGELMMMMYSDPFARIRDLIDQKEEMFLAEGNSYLDGKGALIGSCRDTIKELHILRAARLSKESLALPPTHFFILSVLTMLILVGYSINILPSVDTPGNPPNESSVLFACLFSTYVLFYNFAQDLNNPFQGVYQVRRSSTAVHLLEAKWLISNHPLLKGHVDFDEADEQGSGSVVIRTPGLGDLWFEENSVISKMVLVKDSKSIIG